MLSSDTQRWLSLIKLGREERFLEYKQSRPWGDLKDKITKTALGMANTRDGGTIIIGVSQKGQNFQITGMVHSHIKTYDSDEVQAYINTFADPYIRIEQHVLEEGSQCFLAIAVHEFDELPVICKQDCGAVLRQGAVYARSYRMPETCEVRTQTEMREIIDMATEKALRRLISRLKSTGVSLKELGGGDDSGQFDEQLEGL